MNAHRTPWFLPHIQPVHTGVYERDYGNGIIFYSYWSGSDWCAGRPTSEDAEVAGADGLQGCSRLPWRGLIRSAEKRVFHE
jgi:hypothetical protein